MADHKKCAIVQIPKFQGPSIMTAFEEFGVLPEIAKAIDDMCWTLPTDVQAEAIPAILGGGDVLMAAETGSGKTAAFCVPIIQIVWETLRNIEESKSSKPEIKSAKPWTMSIVDRDSSFVVAPCGLKVQSREFKDWQGGRCSTGVKNGGVWYYEATISDEGLCRVGWSTLDAVLNLGTDRFGYGFGGTGMKSNNKQFDAYGEAFGKSDVIGCILNLDKGQISFEKNGKDLGLAFRIHESLRNRPIFPAIVLKNAEMTINFGHQPLKYLPANCTPICKAGSVNISINTTTSKSQKTGGNTKHKILNAPQAVIIEPSRELAEQTHNQISSLKKHLDSPAIREVLLIGGTNAKDQISKLSMGVDIVVATPGRLEEFVQSGYIKLSQNCFFVLDEADGLLKQGYTEFIERLHKQMPKITIDSRRLQMIVCSATLHSFEVKKMAEKLMHFPTWIDLKGEDAVPETVHHVVCLVDPQKDKSWQNAPEAHLTDKVHQRDHLGQNSAEALSQAVKILKLKYCVQAIDEHNMDRVVIFCRTKVDCDNLEKYFQSLSAAKYSCVCLHGDRIPAERKSNLEKFKNNSVRFLICTDVAARGLDIRGLPFMINFTMPDEKSNYVHRVGRVGRAERMGLAISLVSVVPEKVWYHGQWCSSRGKNCSNTNLTVEKGCCIWYQEKQILAEVEDHLNITIEQITPNFKVPFNEFDGKVVYGEKKHKSGSGYKDHTDQMVPIVKELAKLECEAQLFYLQRFLTTIKTVK